jgi:alanine racemase
LAYIELSKKNYFYNLDILCQKLGSKDRLAVVLKDNAYGHGLTPMASLAQEYGIKRAIVRNTHEALSIESKFENILILAETKNYEKNPKFDYVINDLSTISLLSGCNTHLKIDTGMHRNGIAISEIEEAYKLILSYDISLNGVMTHFRSADELSSELFWQMKVWNDVKDKVLHLTKKHKLKRPLFHSANSATVLRVKNYKDDFARCGIASFGYEEMPKTFEIAKLKPVLSLFAQKIASRELKKGQRVGYGGSFEAKENMVVSTYDIGYGDGFFRFLDDEKILGRVSMDSFSMQGDSNRVILVPDAKKITKKFGTISYDVLTKLSPSIKRIIVD